MGSQWSALWLAVGNRPIPTELIVELSEFLRQLVAQCESARLPTCPGFAAGSHLDHEWPRPGNAIADMLSHRLQKMDVAIRSSENLKVALGLSIDHFDSLSGLIGGAKMRLERVLPGPQCFSILCLTAFLAILRQLRLCGQILVFVRVGSDHKANDLVSTLQIHAMLVVIGEHLSPFLGSSIAEEPALRRFHQHAVRELGPYTETRGDGEGVRRILFSPQDRQF